MYCVFIAENILALSPDRWGLNLYGLHKNEVRKVLGWPDRPENEFKGGDIWTSCRLGVCVHLTASYDRNCNLNDIKRNHTFQLKGYSEVMLYPDKIFAEIKEQDITRCL